MNKQTDHEYTPVSCAAHSEYELAIMHRQALQLTWRDEDQHEHTASVIPVDIKIREHKEFLLADLPDKTRLEIRLDRIIGKTDVS